MQYNTIPHGTKHHYTIPVVHVEILNHPNLLFMCELFLEAPVCLVLKLDIVADPS